MQDTRKIPVEMNKTLDENYLMIKEHCNFEMYNQMMYSLQIKKRHVILEYNICTILDNGIRSYAQMIYVLTNQRLNTEIN